MRSRTLPVALGTRSTLRRPRSRSTPIGARHPHQRARANNPNITIRTNASCADEWSTVGATLQVGSGCAALGSCSGAGTCDYCTQKCSCYEGFGAASDLVDAAFNALDCTLRRHFRTRRRLGQHRAAGARGDGERPFHHGL